MFFRVLQGPTITGQASPRITTPRTPVIASSLYGSLGFGCLYPTPGFHRCTLAVMWTCCSRLCVFLYCLLASPRTRYMTSTSFFIETSPGLLLLLELPLQAADRAVVSFSRLLPIAVV